MSNVKLSHSAIGKYQTCGKMYEYHYIQKLRPKVHSAALVFGDAFDKGVSFLLANPTQLDAAISIFIENFTNNTINDTLTYVPTYPGLVYSNNDFDRDLLMPEEIRMLEEKYQDDIIPRVESIKAQKKAIGWEMIKREHKELYNEVHWHVMKTKGRILLEAYYTKVLPLIEKVHATQEMVTLDNGHGDIITGYVDLIADVKGHGTVILDNKTAGMEYAQDSVLSSQQLSLYVHCLEEKYKTRKAGYIVLLKNLVKNKKKVCSECGNDGSGARHKTCNNTVDDKRCEGEWIETVAPEGKVQIIIDEVPILTENIVMENFDTVNNAIKHKIFPRNFNTCQNVFGSVCSYYGLCYRNSDKGLVKKESK